MTFDPNQRNLTTEELVEKLGEPGALWENFADISRIPRCSKHEGKIREHITAKAEALGLEHRIDKAGNLLVKREASPGYGEGGGVILQGHMDMVCEKNEGVEHDFSADPLKLRIKGDHLYATDTTLGADNGIGLAAMLALMEGSGIEHPPLEFLFTVDEETGLTGAFKLEEGFLEGRNLLNLDSEEEGAIYVGCAGGADSVVTLPLEGDDLSKGELTKITVKGLLGGHSGLDIDKGRANANQLLGRTLKVLARKTDIRLADMSGGSKRNAIPREARAKIYREGDRPGLVSGIVEECRGIFSGEYGAEKGIVLESERVEEEGGRCYTADSTKRAIDLLMSLPNGVQGMSREIPDLVETSTNLATVELEGDRLKIRMNSRSSVETSLDRGLSHIESIADLAGATFKGGSRYPGWKPDLDTELLGKLKEAYGEVIGKEAEIKAIHAGLETGIIGEKFPGMAMVSFGPHIEHPHSPNERVKISSVKVFWDVLLAVLEKL